jgi:hypothetical protein
MFLMGIALFLNTTIKIFRKNHSSMTEPPPVLFGINSAKLYFFNGYLTALALLSSSLGLYLNLSWGLLISLLALVALIYMSLKNFSWRIHEEGFIRNEILQILGFTGGAVCMLVLILHFQ